MPRPPLALALADVGLEAEAMANSELVRLPVVPVCGGVILSAAFAVAGSELTEIDAVFDGILLCSTGE